MKRLISILVSASVLNAYAGSAAWNLDPVSSDWNTAANWTPATVPNGRADVATFAASNITEIFLSAGTGASQIAFGVSVTSFTTTVNSPFVLTLSGPGITNDSGMVQSFVLDGAATGPGVMQFTGAATAGSTTSFAVNGGDGAEVGGTLQFFDTASAGSATIVNGGAASSNAIAATTIFNDTSTAGTAMITAEVGPTGFESSGGSIEFMNHSSAGNANLIANGGSIYFFDHSTAANGTVTVNGVGLVSMGSAAAANSTLIANSGSIGIGFIGDEGQNTARVELHGTGILSLTFSSSVDPNVGSIEGEGVVLIPVGQNFNVGGNDLSTVFAGLIQDDSDFEADSGGSLTKIGSGTLTLSGANTYSGGTTVTSGTLRVRNQTGSATGPNTVRLDGGVLSGGGTIEGAVIVGTGGGTGAVLAPGQGVSQPTTLTLQSTLTLKSDATYTYKLNTKKAKADQVAANGVTIESGAQFSFNRVANKKLTVDTVFTAISNTSSAPISGTFANLPDNSTFTSGRNNYQANYEGGDGNDLTLTVVP